jgi:hypothetical protein
MSNAILSSRTLALSILSVIFYALLFVPVADAASLKLSPSTGIYTAGKSFTISVALNTDGKSVNAADGKLTFNPKELQVVSVSRASSIFNLWTEEPSFSNTQGTIAFGGGSPTGYKGTSGAILNITRCRWSRYKCSYCNEWWDIYRCGRK